VISTIVDSIPIDFDNLWKIHVFVLFTIGLAYRRLKKASLWAQNPLGGFILEPTENPIWQPAPNGCG
jgi:hypothetical protein